jgi:hypothetical protein
MATLDKKLAFFHVIDSHRWLAASGCAWNLVGPNGPQQGNFDQDLPNIVVMIRDCLLLHARSLINFYTDHTNHKKDCTDILLRHYGISKRPTVEAEVGSYRSSIERHLLHLTFWRDDGYRSANTPKAGNRTRPDWNGETSAIAEKLIFECLRSASEQSGDWQPPFKALYDATVARYQDIS